LKRRTVGKTNAVVNRLQTVGDLFFSKIVESQQTTIAIQLYLDELNGAATGVPAEPLVRNVLERAVSRLQWLCELMLERQYPRLMRGPLNLTPDELLSGVIERLLKAMREIHPETVRQFFALANRHMRWELNDLARKLDAQGHAIELRDSQHAAPNPPDPSFSSVNMSRVLEAIEAMPEDEREVFTLMRIQGMTRAETAQIVGIAEKTVQRRLKRGLILLHQVLNNIGPMHLADLPETNTDTDTD
jgi:RNA polymerase sigma factor (sigma-70 family)